MFVLIFTFALMSNMPAANAQFQEDFADEELVLIVTKQPYVLSEGVIALQRDGNFYLPLIELAELFDFVVDANLEEGTIDGWYLTEENTFSIDTKLGELVHLGEKRSLRENEVIIQDFGGGFGDFYVLQETINTIWPLDLNVDLFGLILKVDAEQKLPFELKLERLEKQELIEARRRFFPTKKTNLPFVPNDYRLLGLPALDLDYEAKWDDPQREFTSRVAMSGSQDLLWAQADYAGTLAYDAEGQFQAPRNIRLRFLRQFFQDEAPLGIKEVRAGDTRVRPRDLVKNSVSGRGVSISSEPIIQDRSFDEITIEGVAVPGYEIELYRNNQLIDFGEVDELGEYRFENVELEVGNNQFRIVLYGPQGQIEERTENYLISGGMLKPGENQYRLGIVDSDRPLILLENDPRSSSRGMAQEGYYAHGINKWLTVFGSATRLPTREEERKYVTVGAMFTALGGVGQVEAYRQLGGGDALDTRFATRLLGINLNLQSTFFNAFESDNTGFGQGAKTYEGELRATRTFKLPFASLGLQLSADHEQRKSGTTSTSLNTRQSIGRAGIRITHGTSSSFTNEIHQTSSGSISATVRMRQWQLRSGMNYTIHPEFNVNNANAEIRYRGSDRFSAAVSAQHSFLTSIINAGAQVSYDFGSFLGSFDTDWAKEDGFTFTVRASTSLGPFDNDGSYKFSSRKLSSSTPLKAKIFLDRDNDGVFGEGDEPIDEAKVLIDGRGTKDQTDETGQVIVRGGGLGGVANVEVDKSSLFDPYYQPATEGYSTVLRQGGMPYMEFPVIETGAIDGTVLNDNNGEAISGMTLELVNSKGEVVATTETAFDGFYSFEFIPPDDYTVRADPSYEVNVPPVLVSVASDDLFAFGIDLALLEQAEEAKAAEENAAISQEVEVSHDAVGKESGGVAQTHHSKGTGQPAPRPTDGNFAAVVNRVRIGEHPDKVRFVLDLSGPAAYELSCKKDCAEVQLDLPNVAWSAISHWRASNTPLVQGFETQALAGGGTRITIKARETMSVGLNGVLGPHVNAGKGHRFYLDLQ